MATRRKSEITRAHLGRGWPHQVAISAAKLHALENKSCIVLLAALSAAPLTHSLRHLDEMVFCLTKLKIAEAFCERFGVERLASSLPSGRR